MPFLIHPPCHPTTTTPTLAKTFIVTNPDHNARTILRDLQSWGWKITRHDAHDVEFRQTLVAIDKDVKDRRRQTHAIEGRVHGYHQKLSLEAVWESEAERVFAGEAWVGVSSSSSSTRGESGGGIVG